MPGKPDKADLEQLLSSYIDQTCSDQERQQVEEALRRDPQLRALHGQLDRTVEAVRNVASEATPSHLRERILSQLERQALIGMPAAAGASAAGPQRSRPVGWLGLLAAAMLVAGVGATWWYRTQPQKANYQVAMAPAEPPRDQPIAGKAASPQAYYQRESDTDGTRQPDGASSDLQRSKAAQPPAAAPAKRPPSAPVWPQTPVLVGRAERSAAKVQAPPQTADRALAMREKGRPTAPAEHDAVGTISRPLADDIAGSGRAVSEPEPMAGESLADAAAPADVPASSPANQEMATALAAAPPPPPAAPVPAMAPPAPPAASMPVAAYDRLEQVKAQDGYATLALESDETSRAAGAPAVAGLQVTVADAGRIADTHDLVRALVTRHGGQVLQSSDTSVILATVPAAHEQDLAEAIVQTPGVTKTRSRLLPSSDPLAQQAAALAAGQWADAARQFLAILDSLWQLEQTSWPTSVNAGAVNRLAEPPAPQEQAPLIILIESAAASQPAGQ